jgi:hypothetical protein
MGERIMKEVCIHCSKLTGETVESPTLTHILDEEEFAISITPCDECIKVLKEDNDLFVVVMGELKDMEGKPLTTFLVSKESKGIHDLYMAAMDHLSIQDRRETLVAIEATNTLYIHPILADNIDWGIEDTTPETVH